MVDHANVIQEALAAYPMKQGDWWLGYGSKIDSALDALSADLAATKEANEDALHEIGDYSEGLAPADLLAAIQWLIAEDTKNRADLAATKEENENLRGDIYLFSIGEITAEQLRQASGCSSAELAAKTEALETATELAEEGMAYIPPRRRGARGAHRGRRVTPPDVLPSTSAPVAVRTNSQLRLLAWEMANDVAALRRLETSESGRYRIDLLAGKIETWLMILEPTAGELHKRGLQIGDALELVDRRADRLRDRLDWPRQ